MTYGEDVAEGSDRNHMSIVAPGDGADRKDAIVLDIDHLVDSEVGSEVGDE